MKQPDKNVLSQCIEYGLCVLMVVAGFLTITLYWSIPMFTRDSKFLSYFILLTISGVMSIFILWQARCIMRIINYGNPFIDALVRRLRLIGVECIFLAVVYFVFIFLVTKFFMAIVFITFTVVGSILLVFAELFRQAIAYKNENDMTI